MARKNNNSFTERTIPKTLRESIYNYLKDAIIKNKMKANHRIVDWEIAELFGVSTTPVREAVLKLGVEGFVTINTHREALIRGISYDELKDILQVLASLDRLAVSLIVENIAEETLKDIDDLFLRMERNSQPKSIEKYMELNRAIHNKIWKALPNKFLRETLLKLQDQLLRYSYACIFALRKPGALERSLSKHREWIEALKQRDKDRLEGLTMKHWSWLIESSPFQAGLEEFLSAL